MRDDPADRRPDGPIPAEIRDRSAEIPTPRTEAERLKRSARRGCHRDVHWRRIGVPDGRGRDEGRPRTSSHSNDRPTRKC